MSGTEGRTSMLSPRGVGHYVAIGDKSDIRIAKMGQAVGESLEGL